MAMSKVLLFLLVAQAQATPAPPAATPAPPAATPATPAATPAPAAATPCHDVTVDASTAKTAASGGTADEICSYNVIWAKTTGITDDPAFYLNFTGINADSPDADFQCALYAKAIGEENGDGHNCTKPCTADPIYKECAPPTTTTVAPEEDTSSMPWWGVVLIVLGLILAGAAAYYFLTEQKKQPKKKRALAKPAPKVEPPPPPPVVQTVYTSHPVMAQPVYHPQHITYAAPAAPIYHAAPVNHSFVMAGPPQYAAAPVHQGSIMMAGPPQYAAAMEMQPLMQ